MRNKYSFIKRYKYFIGHRGLHEIDSLEYIKERAIEEGEFLPYVPYKKYKCGDKILFEFRDKLIALVELGQYLPDGANLIVSHIDSPRLDVIPGNPIVEKEDGVFLKVQPYGGIIPQLWYDRPLVLVGRVFVNGKLTKINTARDEIYFNITSLLPHLNGRKELKDMTYDKLLVRVGNKKADEFLDFLKNKYGIEKEDLELADLSFVPYNSKIFDIGFDKDFMMGYGHDDRSCAFAELEAMLYGEKSNMTKIALFTSFEETGSGQMTGAESQFIDDIFLDLAEGNIQIARECMRNTKVLSADVCAGFDSNYNSHFEDCAKAVVGKGVALVPFTGIKRGNDASVQMRNYVKELCVKNDIEYQIETTKVSEGGGGTVAKFFATRGMEVIDAGVPTLSMHSPQEVISKKDLIETYKLYKIFLESN